MSVFEKYANYYNLLYKDKNYEAETEYITRLIRKFNPHCKTILELGCGTGKHAKILQSKGFDIFGIDMSEQMIDQARALDVECEQGDCRFYRCNKKFDAVISLFHVASYQTSDEDVLNYFNTASSHLKKDGNFIFDLWYKPAVLSQVPEKRVKKLENENFAITRKCEPIHIAEKSIVEINYDIDIQNKTDGAVENIKEKHVMRYFSKDEILDFAEKAGLAILHFEEWLSAEDPSEKTWGVCFIGVKR